MGRWKKKRDKRYYFKPDKGQRRKYTIGGDYIFDGMSENDIKKYTRLSEFEEKARKKGLTVKEYRRFRDLEKWNKKKEKLLLG